MDSIHIHSRAHEPSGATVITVHGFIDTATSADLEKELQRILRSRCYRIVIDLTGVDYISSAGWGIFLSEIRRIRQQGGDLCLVGMKVEVREVYELLEFRAVLNHFHTLAEAVDSFLVAGEPTGAPARA
jgi:anti-anti-sigma factor